jgi:hypothetical protein
LTWPFNVFILKNLVTVFEVTTENCGEFASQLDCTYGMRAVNMKNAKASRNIQKLKAAQKHLDRALASYDRAASLIEEAGLAPMTNRVDEVADAVEDLSNTLASL